MPERNWKLMTLKVAKTKNSRCAADRCSPLRARARRFFAVFAIGTVRFAAAGRLGK